MMKGGVEAGPNAVLALREKDILKGFSVSDLSQMFFYSDSGRWHQILQMALENFIVRSVRKLLWKALQKLIPEIQEMILSRVCGVVHRHWNRMENLLMI